jgi:hypothetical protein
MTSKAYHKLRFWILLDTQVRNIIIASKTVKHSFTMEKFESKLSRATTLESLEILGAVGIVVDREGANWFFLGGGFDDLRIITDSCREHPLPLCIWASNSCA